MEQRPEVEENMRRSAGESSGSAFGQLFFGLPHIGANARGVRRRLLSIMLVVVVLLLIGLLVGNTVVAARAGSLTPKWTSSQSVLLTVLVPMLVFSFVLNRKGYYVVAAVTFVLAVFVGVVLANHFTMSGVLEPVFSRHDTSVLAYLALPIMLAAALVSVRMTIGMMVLCFGGMLLVPRLYSHITFAQVLTGPFQYLLTIIAAVILLSYFLTHHERQAITDLSRSERRFRSLFDQSLDPIFIVGVDGIVKDVNEAVTRVFGYSPHFLIGRHVETVYADPDERGRIIESVHRDGYLHDEPLKLRTSDDSILDCLITIWARRGLDGRMLEYQTIVRDVTEHLRAEEDNRLRGELLDLAFDPILLVDPAGEIVYANEALSVLTGYSPDELLGMNMRTLNTPETAEEVPSRIAAMLREGALDFETRWLCKNCKPVAVEVRTRTVESGGRTLFLSVVRDVTRRKQDEAQLRLRSELLDLTNDAVFLHDLQGRFLYVNEAAASGRGYARDQLMQMSLQDIAYFEDVAQFHDRIADLVTKGSLTFESHHRHKDGRLLPLEVRSRLIEMDGRPLVLSVARDIAERKQAEQELRQSERKYRELFEQSMDAVAVFSIDGTLLDANPAHMRLFGNTEEDVGRRVVLQHYVDSADRDEFIRMLERDGVVVDQEVRLRKRDGTEMDCIRTAVAVRDEEGHVSRIQTVTRDITERKRIEDALLLTQRTVDQAAMRVFWIRPDGSFAYVNEETCRSLGYSCDELLTMSVHDIDPNYSAQQRPEYWDRIRNEGSVTFQTEHITRNGDHLEVEVTSTYFSAGDVELEVTFARDISESRRAWQEVEESELRFRSLVENTGVGILMSRLTGEILDCNDAAPRMFGYDRDEFLSLNVRQLYARESDREQILEAFRQQGFLRAEVIEFKRKDGGLLYVALTSAHVPLRGECIVMSELLDVTEQRKAEEELRASREQLRLLTMYLEDARERERTGIARELHDQLGQALTALGMDLSTVISRVEKGQPVSLDHLREMSRLVDETSKDVRRISSELRPGMLDDIGLVSALEWQLTQWALRMGIEYDFLPEADDVSLDKAQSTALFRVFQEVLTNVARHAGATHVQVGFLDKDGRAILTVKDNGRGITEDQIDHAESLGIVGMRERIRPLGGSLEITGVPGKGTTVIASVPTSRP